MEVDVLFLSVDAVASGRVDCETQIQLVCSSSLSFSGSFYRPEQLCITLELFRNHPAGGQEDRWTTSQCPFPQMAPLHT